MVKVEKDLQESVARSDGEIRLEELDARATDISHSTMESLFKSSTWYEKKIQTQMQGVAWTRAPIRPPRLCVSAQVKCRRPLRNFQSWIITAAASLNTRKAEVGRKSVKDTLSHTQQTIQESVDARQRGSRHQSPSGRASRITGTASTRRCTTPSINRPRILKRMPSKSAPRWAPTKRDSSSLDFQIALNQRAMDSLQSSKRELESQVTATREAAIAAHQLRSMKNLRIPCPTPATKRWKAYKGRMENASSALPAARFNSKIKPASRATNRNFGAQRGKSNCATRLRKSLPTVGDSLRERLLGVASSLPSTPKLPAEENSENK